MDSVAGIILEPVTRGVNWLIDSTLTEADYAWNCKKYVADLRDRVHLLKEERERFLRIKTEAEKRGETIITGVDQWLKDTKQFIQNAEGFLTLEDSPKMKCCVVMCPNCKTRHQRGRKAKVEMLEEVNRHIADSEKFQEIAYRQAPPSLRPVKEYESFESRASNCKEIMELMCGPSVNKIGLYGINGVGKTALVTEIARQALENKLFDEVAMTTVFQDHNMKEMHRGMAVLNAKDIRRIQGEIAEGLGFPFHSETEFGRERELRERLKDGKKKLLVLDDIWAKFELEKLGIPDGLEGCKILMTSINQPVLCQMGSENNFKLDKLPDNEARDWFNRMVGDVFENPDLGNVAEKVADKCGGLPISLIPVAKGLKGKVDVITWNEALEQLSNEMHADVNLALQLSYNLLVGDEIKSLFRLCGQISDPIFIDYLFEYSFGLGLLTQSNTSQGRRSQLLTFIKKLKDSCLLLEGNSSEVVKMHETVRSFAVSVASRDYRVFTVAPYTTLSDWPEKNVLRNLTAVSLQYCNIPDLPQVFECPELESFFLSSNDPSLEIPDNPSLKIPDDFFVGMRKLKVLDLTKIHFSHLPPSLQFLKDLQTLCLDLCVLKDIKVIGELKRLQVLSFVGSDINELPKELQQLARLKVLDLSSCKSLAKIKVRLIEVLSSLGQLEELCMEDTVLQWDFEGLKSNGISASLAKLKHLSKLDIHITDVKMLPKGMSWEGLKWFRIFIGEGWNWSDEYKTPTTLKIKLNTSIKWEMGLKSLLKKTEDLHLDELKGIQSSVYELDVSGFRQLKHLHVENSSDIQFIVNSTRLGPCDAFTSLESLYLDNLQKLKKICEGPLMPVSFRKLRVLDVGGCGALESVISSSMVGLLLRLEEIKITDCKSLKEIITEDSKDDAINDKAIELPQLRKLVLRSLPQFSRFCSNVKAPSMSQTRRNMPETSTRSEEIVHEIEKEPPMPLFSERINIRSLKKLKLSSIPIDKIWDDQILGISSCIQNLTSFTIFGCDKLKYLFSSLMLGSLVNLKTLQVSNCRMIEQIIITEGVVEGMNKVTFFPLDHLQLENLPELTQVCRSNLFECPALKELSIMNCPKLRKFVSKTREENVAVVNEAEASSFSLFDEKVAFSNLEGLTITKMNGVKLIWHDELIADSFSKLKRLSISNAEELVKLFPSNYVLSKFKNVETLSIEDCNTLEDIFGLEATRNATHLKVVSKLKMLEIKNLENLKHIWNKDAIEALSFPNLETVNVSLCPNLKSIFPASVARGLSQLGLIRITDCGVEDIVSKEEAKELTAYFYFPLLTHIILWRLPHLQSFYPERHTAEFPKLKYLRVYGCDKMEMFSSESHNIQEQCFEDQTDESSQQQPLFSSEKIPDLEELPLMSKDAKTLLEGHYPVELGNVKVLYLQCFRDESTIFPFDLIERFHNLKQLTVAASCFKEIFGSDGVTELQNHGKNIEKIQVLILDLLYNLKHIKLDNVLNNLQELFVRSCHSLTNFASPSASFQNLKVLDVQYCRALVSLMTSSTAESLVQLTEMSVANCIMLREIITNEGDERKAQITFQKLESLRFDGLRSLTSFSSVDCSLTFLSLEEVILQRCPNMRVFSPDPEKLHAPKLRTVQTEGTEKIPWMGSLSSTVQHLYEKHAGFVGLEDLDLSKFPQLEGKWPDQFPVRFFDKLKSLIVNAFTIRSSAIPANILPYLNVLEKLEVRNCNSIEEVFGIGQSNAPESSKHLSALCTLELSILPNLKHLWSENANGMLDFRKLKQIKIHNCDSLGYIFTPPVLLGLSQLQEIEVKSCSAIREIVAEGAAQGAVICVRFPKLNSITLEGLPNLKCFYSGSGIVEFPCLKMVAIADCQMAFTSSFLRVQEQSPSKEVIEAEIIIPNLKEIKLSSILIEWIWDVKLLEISSCLQNLTSLTVDGCHELKYLFSSFITEILVNLKTLQVINCRMMEEIIFNKGFGEDTSHVTFYQLDLLRLQNLPKLAQVCSCDLFECPALKELKIVNCPKLSTFISKSGEENEAVSNDADLTNCSLFDEKVGLSNLERLEVTNMKCIKMIWHEILQENSFSKLKQLSISNVEKLVGIFPCNYMLSKFTNLEALSIARCKFLKNIIGFEAMTNSTHKKEPTELKTPELKRLSNMKRIWNNDAVETLSLSKMQKVDVSDCPNLKSLFPASVAKVLLQLTSISITDCGIEEIVSAEVGKELVSDFAFPRLTDIKLWRLAELKRFYPGRHTAEFPKLKNLAIYNCEKFAVFTTESQFFQEQCCANEIESPQEQPLLSAEKVIPTLEQLSVNHNDARMLCEEQFPADLLCNVTFLRLHSFHDESTMFPLGLIQRFNSLDRLDLVNCCFREIFLHDGFVDEKNQTKNLEKVRFLNLVILYNLKQIQGDYVLESLQKLGVWQCHSLTNLALPSAFQNLKILDVQDCRGLVSFITPSTAETLVQLTELCVANCEKLREILANEGDESKSVITFHKLEKLRLDCLASLTNFCSAVCTLRFPALEKVILEHCPKMTIFSKGDLHAPNLGLVKTESTEYKPHWMGDLNSTVKQMYAELAGFDGVRQMKLSEFPELKIKWPDELPVKFFGNLRSLVVDDCAFCSIAVPSELVPSLNALEELEVRHCDSVEEVFDVGQPNGPISIEHLSSLTKIHLVDLPKLKHLWTQNVQGMLDLRELKQIKIQNCGSLRYVFTPSMLVGLSHLQEIEVGSCPAIEEIVANDEEVEEIVAKDEADDAIIFPLLNSVTLEDLPKLTIFYCGSRIVKFPCLKMVAVVDCPKTFTLSFLKGQEQSTSDEATEAKVALPSLEKLKLIWGDAIDELIQADIFCQLKVFELIRFPDDHAAFPSRIFQKLPCLEHLVLSDAAFEEIALQEETNDKECHSGIAPLIKELKVSKFPKLTVFSTESQMLLQDLQSLRVSECVNLKLLLPVSVSFERLTVLEVSKCHGLINLISKAESSVQLTTLSVTDCQTMTEIVAEEEMIAGNVIIFHKLKCLRLQSLPKLTKFYSGKYALMFPTLEEVYMSECPSLEAFSQGEVKMPKLKKLQLPMGEDEGYGEGSHYVHLQQLFIKMKQIAAQSRSLSLPRHRNVEFQITHEEKAQDIFFSTEIVHEDLHTSKNPNSSQDPSVECETSNKVASERETVTASLREVKIIDVTLDYPVTSTNKNDSTECEDIPCNSKENDTHISLKNLNDDIAAKKDEVSPDSSIPPINEASNISHSHATAFEHFEPTSKSPSFQFAETSTRTATHFGHLLVGTDEVPAPTSSLKLAMSSVTEADPPESIRINLEHTYRDHIGLLKKILIKPLSEVSRSQDVDVLLSTLENLKNCPHLNSRQSEIIQNYIDHFDTLVIYQSFYEDQIGRASALQVLCKRTENKCLNSRPYMTILQTRQIVSVQTRKN